MVNTPLRSYGSVDDCGLKMVVMNRGVRRVIGRLGDRLVSDANPFTT